MSVPATGMALSDIRREMDQQRFGPNMNPSLDRWVRMREAMVWSDSEWPFKRIRREPLTASSAKPTMPTAYWKTVSLEQADGTQLVYLSPDDFNLTYEVNDTTAGPPANYTVTAGQIYLGPAGTGQTLYHSYDRRPSHFDGTDELTAGTMTADDDYPVYPPEYHYMLAVGAMASGLKVQNDPTWDALEQEFQQMLVLMREDLLPPDQYSTNQFGRDGL